MNQNRMKLKQFLKPDWRKIVLSVILLVTISTISFCIAYIEVLDSLVLLVGPIFWILIIQTIVINLDSEHFLVLVSNPKIILVAIIPIYSYILSCILIWIYDKRKKK